MVCIIYLTEFSGLVLGLRWKPNHISSHIYTRIQKIHKPSSSLYVWSFCSCSFQILWFPLTSPKLASWWTDWDQLLLGVNKDVNECAHSVMQHEGFNSVTLTTEFCNCYRVFTIFWSCLTFKNVGYIQNGTNHWHKICVQIWFVQSMFSSAYSNCHYYLTI